VLDGDRVVVDVGNTSVRGNLLGDLVDVAHGGDARADVKELADARLPGEVADGPAQERPVRAHRHRGIGPTGQELPGCLLVSGEVV
jgi:hypothetical protein